MGFLWDIAEIAGLLFVAYMAGWLVGYLAHRLIARAPASVAITAPEPAAAPLPAADALVKAPVIVPVTGAAPPQVLTEAAAIEPVNATAVPGVGGTPPEPTAPTALSAPVVSGLERLKSLSTSIPLVPVAEVPAAVGTESGAAEIIAPASPVPDAAPEPAAPQPELSAEPPVPAEPVVVIVPEPRGAEPPAPPPQAEPLPPEPIAPAAPAPPAAPANAPGMPWAGAMNGHEPQKFSPENRGGAPTAPLSEEVEEPDAALDVALLSSLADGLKIATPAEGDGSLAPDAGARAPQRAEQPSLLADEVPPVETPRPAPLEPSRPAGPSAAAPASPAVEPPPPAAPRRPTLDEDAAMRAIEGGWSRRDVRALPDAPELADVTAAVSAAQVAVEQVLARNGVSGAEPEGRAQATFGKPAGLSEPRDGHRDNLRRIDGLGPLDEVTLNNLGIYHFDQIAGWNEREVLWLENHAFAVGRIAREDWQEQARELASDRDVTRAAR